MELLADRYELHGTLGVGGMAEVREAHDRVLDRRVAVKLLRSDLSRDPTVRERFLREARNAARFSHPNAVAVFDTGVSDERPYMVMELVEGQTLADRLRTTGPMAAAETVTVADEILSVLAAAHATGLVHRDVKPGNVMLPNSGGVKLVDFGIAKGVQEATIGLTATGQIIGTPAYLSPEQVEGDPATPASDVYAVGVVMFEMLTGRPPYTADSAVATALAHTTRPVPSVRAAAPHVDERVAALVERALQKDPQQRFVDAQAMRDALRGRPDATTAVVSPAPTAVMAPLPRGTTPTAAPVGHDRRATPWLLLGVAALLLLGVAAFAMAGDEDPTASVPQARQPQAQQTQDAESEAPAPAQDPRATEAQAPVTEPVEGEQAPAAPDPRSAGDLPSLIEIVASNPEAYGAKQPEVLDRLARIADSDDEKQQAEWAAETIRETAAWAAEGQITPELATATGTVLAPIAAALDEDGDGGEGNEKGKGKGNGKGNDKDDGD